MNKKIVNPQKNVLLFYRSENGEQQLKIEI